MPFRVSSSTKRATLTIASSSTISPDAPLLLRPSTSPSRPPPGASDPAATASPNAWTLAGDDGDARQAVVMGSSGTVLAVACSPDRRPSLTVRPDPFAGIGSAPEVPVFRLSVDGRAFDQAFRCVPGADRCGSDGSIPPELVSALRRGSRLVLEAGLRGPESFTLRGSSVAIASFGRCGD